MVLSWRRFRERATAVLHLDEEPSRLAAGMATGVFIGLTPFYGLHTLLALVAAYVFRLNKAATITGAWLNLPWFAPFVYAGAVWIGSVLLPDLSGVAGWSVWLLVGSTTLGLAAAGVTWLVAFSVLRARRRSRGEDDEYLA
jgi:uncharacterized protein (DUF2062 family)